MTHSLLFLLFCTIFLPNNILSSTTSELLNRLQYYEIVHIVHNQFNKIDELNPVYPTNGLLEFNAFGRHYQLWFRKNTELFHKNFRSQYHNDSDIKILNFEAPRNCYYSGKVLINNFDGSSSYNTSSKAAFSACKNKGIRGWIYGFDELIIIRPQKLLMHNINNNDSIPIISINDAYIIYRYDDVDRSDYPHNKGSTICGYGYDIDHNHNYHDNHRHLLQKDQVIQHIPGITSNNNGIRYVELAAVNDPAMVQHYKNLYGTDWNIELQAATISIINTVQQYYLGTDWGDNIGSIHIVLIAIYYISDWNDYGSNYEPRSLLNYVSSNNQIIYCDECEPNLFCPGCLGQSNYYQIDYSDYLTKFHDFRIAELDQFDNAHLFSYYDFFSTVIGLASLPGMCIQSYSGGIEQTTYDDEYNGNIVAHEMGHNFNMQHDGQGNTCNHDEYIMASVGSPYGFRPDSFSSCSIQEINQYFTTYPSVLTCLDNEPRETSFSFCGNGIVEMGETCDCGAADCINIDKCCNGVLCSLYGDAQCSNLDDCCSDCKIINDINTICRELSITNTCDIKEEYCDGISAQCPYDTKQIEGTQCNVINSHYDALNISFGYCYYGECVNIEQQCIVHGSSYTLSTGCGWDEIWRTSSCITNLQCGYTFNEQQCNWIIDETFDSGTPCYSENTNDPPMQCVDRTCKLSQDVYSYIYIPSSWSICSIPCRDENSTEIGYQTRSIFCSMQDGTIVDEINCINNNIYKPSINRTCNDFKCDFCAPLIEKPHICFPNGECDGIAALCICHYGFGGEYCQIQPSLYFIGITSHVYMNLSGITIAQRADPCNVIDDFYDIQTKTQTISIDGVSTLSILSIGSVVGIRWNSTGSLSQLSVGMIRINENGQQLTEWPFYIGVSLANDNQNCQSINTSSYDPCYEKMECNDFSFIIPDDLIPGYYKIIVRFNKEYHIESKIFTVECTNNICNAQGNGQCADNIELDENMTNICECDQYWYGDRCDESVCKDWIFTSNECENEVFCTNYNKPKCFEGSCNNSICECDRYYEGNYCELSNDFCNQITDSTHCNDNELCIYDNIHGCVYNDCFAVNIFECLENPVFEYNNTWPIYCKWNINENDGYCDRISCNINDIPTCHNNAVRRPLFDDKSICYTWYCDCSTTPNDEYWAKPTRTALTALITSNYPWDTALNASYVTDIDLFRCSKCELNCSHNSVSNAQCTNCDNCDRNKWEGIECNHLYWIGFLKINLLYEIVMENYDEFILTIIQDLIYFFNVHNNYITISEVHSTDDGRNVIVYFRYLFDKNVNHDTIQRIGGDIMMNARNQIFDEYSPAITRGFILQFIDSTYEFNWCLPTKEVCKHQWKEIDFWELIGFSALFSYILLGLLIVAWKMWKSMKRKKKKKAQMKQPLSPKKRLKATPNSAVKSPLKKDRNYGTYSELAQVEESVNVSSVSSKAIDADQQLMSDHDLDRI